MNGVSDLKLALACAHAGIVPSLIPYSLGAEEFIEAVKLVKAVTPELQVSYTFDDIVMHRDLIVSLGITHIEILEFREQDLTEHNFKLTDELRANGVKLILKILKPEAIALFANHIDAVTIKGSEGAGRSAKDIDLLTVIPQIKSQYPDLHVIASGGVKDSADVRRLLSVGACAVSIGTLFAMSAESSMPQDVKLKLLNSSDKDIRRLKTGARQRAIVFTETAVDDFNNTGGLHAGLKTGTSGHVFAGNALGQITSIRPVAEIVSYLLA